MKRIIVSSLGYSPKLNAELNQQGGEDHSAWARKSFEEGDFKLAIEDQMISAEYYAEARMWMGIE